jgi:predicted Rossmann-fold nucleotide-binding protein
VQNGGIPFNPLRSALYSAAELFEGFSLAHPASYAKCQDIAILSYFFLHGKNPTNDDRVSMLEALHDNAISSAIQSFLKQRPSVVAVMGGHDMLRGTKPYVDVASLAHTLATKGFLLASGGGPGAMEATHLGALFSKRTNSDLSEAIKVLSNEKALPKNVGNLVGNDGEIDETIAAAVHKWLAPAITVAQSMSDKDGGASLGIPTWLYGYEPTTPFATQIAKYFQNSLREDGLVTIGNHGIIYAEGSAGTVQEIFQDAAKNFYGTFCPMVFLSSPAKAGEHYWEKTLPVRTLIEALLGKKPGFERVLFTDSIDDAANFLQFVKVE